MVLANDNEKRKIQTTTSSIVEAERVISKQIPPGRREEILEYLKLFGYTPDRTIIQVHLAGFFNKKQTSTGKGTEKRQATTKRYGGTTFVIVGRTHDPSIMELVIKPKKRLDQTNPGYIGYLWRDKDPSNRAPHEILPLDFTPIHFHYPHDWKRMFATKAFMLALHVPASFAKNKNQLIRALYGAGKTVNVKQKWDFVDKVKSKGFGQIEASYEDPIRILKIRLARGEITKEQYENLHQTLAA
jgi:hypothetical protein